MGFRLGKQPDAGLLEFIRQLLDDDCLSAAEATVARAALDAGIDSLNATERRLLESEVIEPWLGCCESCGAEPDWSEVLQVFDTGLCHACFEKLAGIDTLGVRPDWMPIAPAPPDDEDERQPETDTGSVHASL